MTLKFNKILEVVEVYVFVLNISKLSAAVHELLRLQAFCPISQWRKIRQFGPVTLTFDLLWPWKSIDFVRLSRHVRAEFHQAAGSGSRVIVLTDKKLRQKQYSPSLPRW